VAAVGAAEDEARRARGVHAVEEGGVVSPHVLLYVTLISTFRSGRSPLDSLIGRSSYVTLEKHRGVQAFEEGGVVSPHVLLRTLFSS